MIQHQSAFASTRVVDTMIELARCAKAYRIIVAGSKSRDLMAELHRRGYTRVTTTATCGFLQGPCPVALLDWRAESIATLEETLRWLAGVLAPAAVMVIWVDSADPMGSRKLASMLEGASTARSSRPVHSEGGRLDLPCLRPLGRGARGDCLAASGSTDNAS
jgi:hypothetical protein